MWLWIIFPISLSLISFIGTWTVYGLAYSNNHVCSLGDWEGKNFCTAENQSSGCCFVPTISTSGAFVPENSLFTATINSGAFLFLLFCIFHHAHVLEKHACQSMLSRVALAFGVVAAFGAFAAGNCNPRHLSLLHYLGAALSFTCICFYTIMLTELTRRCVLTGYERVLYPFRIVATILQICLTICYMIFFSQDSYHYRHLCAVFEWTVTANLELFELSYAVEFCFFSSFMLSNILGQRGEEKPLMMTLT